MARLRDQTFFDLGALNTAIRVLLDQLNDRPLKKLGVSRRVFYEQLDRPALRPLPAARYSLAHWKLCRVNIDYHIEVERHVYSVPYQLVREQVEVRYTTHTVEIFHRDKRVASHRRRYDRQPSTAVEHMPSAHRAHAEWTPSRLIRWAEKVGPATGKLVSRDPGESPAPRAGISRLSGDHAAGTALRKQPARSGEQPRAGPRLLPLPHRQQHPRRRPGPSAPRAAGRDEPDAGARQHPRRRLLRHDHHRGGPMLTQQTLDKLNAMKLGAMADAFQKQLQTAEAAALSFEERLGLLVDTEWTAREQRKLTRRLHAARLRYQATLEAVDYTHPRPAPTASRSSRWAPARGCAERHNLIVTGPCGIGKSFLACALVERACRRGFTARYVRMPRLLHELAVGRGDGSYTRLLARLAKLDLLAIDDWMLAPLRDAERRDLNEVIEDRAERASTLIASQLPVTDWHAVIGDPQPGRCNLRPAAPRRAPHRAQGPLDATDARRTSQPPEEDDMTTEPTTTTPRRTPTITSATRATLPPGSCSLWILTVLWKTRAMRLAADCAAAQGAFPTTPWTPQTAPTATTGNIVRALYTRSRVGYRQPVATPMGAN